MLEILLVVAAIAILAGIVIVAINPGKQLADTRNAQRRSSVRTILDSVYQYAIDHSGTLPAGINETGTCNDAVNEICVTGGVCTGLTDLPEVTSNGTYLVSIPEDPSSATTNGTGYHIIKEGAAGRITVCSPYAEQGVTISVRK